VNATQPGISKQLKLLEEELGFQIFLRRGKSLQAVSPSGAQVVERARVLVSEAANIHALAANHRRETAGELVIATTQTQARFVLPGALKRLQTQSPNVSVRLNLFSDAQRAASARQDADLMVASAVDWPQTADLVAPLYRWRRVALLPAGHPLAAAKKPLTLAQLAAYPLIGYESALGSHATVAAAFAQAGAPAEFAYTAHDTEVIRTLVRSGLGVGLIAEMAVGGDHDLVHRPIDSLPACHAYALLRRDRVARDYLVDLVAALTPHFSRRDLVRALHPRGVLPEVTAPDWRDWQALVKERDIDALPSARARRAAA
jgi:DNA-binding transcriptional LysR family regulator